MRRALFTIATVVSLLLFITLIVFWIRGHYVSDVWIVEYRTASALHSTEVQAFDGRVVAADFTFDPSIAQDAPSHKTVRLEDAYYFWDEYAEGPWAWRWGAVVKLLMFPLWLPALGLAIMPTTWAVLWVRRRAMTKAGRAFPVG